jgi:hypothetical protein
MRTMGLTLSLLVTLTVAGCGSANGLEDGVPEDAPFVPAPKIGFEKPKRPSKSSSSAASAIKGGAPGTGTESKK